MDKLEKSKQTDIRKMSDVRLTSKLTQAGYSIEMVETMDRPTMLDKWAEIVIAGRDVVANPSGATAVASGYDTELEREKLAFQMRQWEDEKLERQAQRDLEIKRLEGEKEYRQEMLAVQQRQTDIMERKERGDLEKENNDV